jgi:hypothetical protein
MHTEDGLPLERLISWSLEEITHGLLLELSTMVLHGPTTSGLLLETTELASIFLRTSTSMLLNGLKAA